MLLNLERVEKVLCEVHGVLHPLHQQVGGVHGQVGQGVVTLFAEIHKVNKKTSALVKFQQTDHHLVEDGL